VNGTNCEAYVSILLLLPLCRVQILSSAVVLKLVETPAKTDADKKEQTYRRFLGRTQFSNIASELNRKELNIYSGVMLVQTL